MSREIKTAEERELKKCIKCGGEGDLKVTSGGFNYYYAIHCKICNHNSRGMGNLLPQLYDTNVPNSPQSSRESAYKAWNKIN